MIHQSRAIAAAIVLGLLIVFQLLLAAGLPLGGAAWRGRYRVYRLDCGRPVWRLVVLFLGVSFSLYKWLKAGARHIGAINA